MSALVSLALLTLLMFVAGPAAAQVLTPKNEGANAGYQSKEDSQETEKPAQEVTYTEAELEMVEAINDYREQNGITALEVADTASKAAEHHSEDMATHGFFDHDTLESDYYGPGASFADRLSEEGYDHNTYRSENIAAGNEGVEETLTQWKNSPGHDENMLNPELEVIGIGKVCSEESRHGCYWSTDFGAYTPERARAVEEIKTSSEQAEPSQDESSTGSPEADSEDGDSEGESDSKVTGESSSTSADSGDPGDSADNSATEEGETSEEENANGQYSGDSGAAQSTDQSTSQSITQTNDQSTTSTGGEDSGESSTQNSTQSQHSVQITENGKTRTLTGDEAEKEICEQFSEAREEAISGLREEASNGEEDQAAKIKNQIADDFEQSLLNPDSCKSNEAQDGQPGPGGTSTQQHTAEDDPDTPETPGSGSSQTTTAQGDLEQPDLSSMDDQYAGDETGGSDKAPGNGSADNQDDEGNESLEDSDGSKSSTDPQGNDYDATATVSRAVDGDTLALEEPVEGKDRVRLIGVDTPEVAYEDGEQDEPYGEKASEFTSEELEGEKVGLKFGQDKEDDYGRLLAYVYTVDESPVNNDQPGTDSGSGEEAREDSMFNEALLRQGYAEVLTVEPNLKYERRFEQAEEKAREHNKGIWSGDSEASELGERTTGEDSTVQEDTSREPKEDSSSEETSSGRNGSGAATTDGDETNMETMGDAKNGAGSHEIGGPASSEDSDEVNDSGDSQNRGDSEDVRNEGGAGDSDRSSESGQEKTSDKADDSGGNDSNRGDEDGKDEEDEGGLKALIMFWE